MSFLSIWKAFVPAEEYHTVARGAYFSREVIPDQLVVVSLNTMYFCKPNIYVGKYALVSDEDL